MTAKLMSPGMNLWMIRAAPARALRASRPSSAGISPISFIVTTFLRLPVGFSFMSYITGTFPPIKEDTINTGKKREKEWCP